MCGVPVVVIAVHQIDELLAVSTGLGEEFALKCCTRVGLWHLYLFAGDLCRALEPERGTEQHTVVGLLDVVPGLDRAVPGLAIALGAGALAGVLSVGQLVPQFEKKASVVPVPKGGIPQAS